MYTSKLKIKTSSVNAWRCLYWWPDCLITSSVSQGRPQKSPPTITAEHLTTDRTSMFSWRLCMAAAVAIKSRLPDLHQIHCAYLGSCCWIPSTSVIIDCHSWT